jgi:hypothetical protein
MQRDAAATVLPHDLKLQSLAVGGLSGGLGQATRFKNHGTWLSVRFPHMWRTDNELNARGHSNAIKYESLLYFSGLPICELHAKAGKRAAEPYCCDIHLTEPYCCDIHLTEPT